MSDKNPRFMLIDGNSILNRAFYALQGQNMLRTQDGVYTNAIYGFLNILNKYISEDHPEHMAVAFDLKAPTFRHTEYEGYKAKRKGMPEELAEQLPLMKEVLDALNIKRYEIEGYEADDIIGTLSRLGAGNGLDVIIITGDRDSFQLVSDKITVKLPVTKGGRTETEIYGPGEVLEKYKSGPEAIVELKGLMGDSSDNIPGVPGVGEKTAIELISKYGSIDNIYLNLESIEKKALREKLETHRDLAYLSRKLATIDRCVPLTWAPENTKRQEADKPRLYNLFRKLQFKSLINQYGLKEEEFTEETNRSAETEQAQYIEIKHKSIINSIEDFKKFKGFIINELQKLSEGHKLTLAVDAVTDTLSEITLCTESGYCVIIHTAEDIYLSEDISESEFAEELKEIIENPAVELAGHDLKPFILYLKNHDIETVNIGFDTLIAAYVLDPGQTGTDLSGLSEKYLKTTLGNSSDPEAKMQTIFALKERMSGLIGQNDQNELYYNIELPLVEVLADLEYTGFNVDKQTLKDLGVKLDHQIIEETALIFALCGEEFNINSPKQLGVILFDKLGLPVKKKTKTGYSTDIETLEGLMEYHPVIQKIIDYRSLVKLKSTYIDGLLTVISNRTGRIHSSFNQTVTVTGRLSSTEPNLQNIPVRLELGREIRKAFIPSDENHILLDADYSQIELRVLAHISEDQNMTEAFEKCQDIHTRTASQVFGVPFSEVTSEMRSRAKAVNFGIVYGIGDFSLAKDIGITRKEARSYIDNYLENFKGVKKYMTDIVAKVKDDGYVTTLFNRRRYVPEIKSSNFNIRSFGERVALNTPIQGTAADIIKIAMIRVYRELRKRGLKSRLILQVHDELIIDTLKYEKEQVSELLKDCMENAVTLRVPLTADVNEGENWFYAK